MIPLRDNIPSSTTPFVTYAIIAACTFVFIQQVRDKDASLVERYGMIPKRVLHPGEPVVIPEQHLGFNRLGGAVVIPAQELEPSAVPPLLTVLTCVFLHGGWLHFLGNMWFLFIFGDNVEDRMGHVFYLLFYLFAGAVASVAHLAVNAGSPIPTIGASGAIAGVMGAYMLLYPRALVLSAIPIFIFIQIVVLPAPLFLGIWFLIQFFQGAMSVTQATGVAWWAHIGGFVLGFLVAGLLKVTGIGRPPVAARRTNADHIGAYRYHRKF